MLTLVTGATGLVGNNVVRALLNRGEAVRVLSREGADPRPLSGLDVECVRGDVRDEAAVARAMKNVDRVIHAAAEVRIGWTGYESARATNVIGATIVADAAQKASAKMVHVSTVDAIGLCPDGTPADEDTPPYRSVFCPYVVTKRTAEEASMPALSEDSMPRSSIRRSCSARGIGSHRPAGCCCK